MLDIVPFGANSNLHRIKINDITSTSNGGLTGLTNSSAGLIISTIADVEATPTAYTVAASHIQTIATLGTYAAPSASNCRFKEVDATNHPGLYELQFADARFAVAGAKKLVVTLSGVTNMAQVDLVIKLTTGLSLDGTLTELSQAQPPVNPTHDQATMLQYMRLRNGDAVTVSQSVVKNDAGTVIAKTALSDDNITFTRGKLVTGP